MEIAAFLDPGRLAAENAFVDETDDRSTGTDKTK